MSEIDRLKKSESFLLRFTYSFPLKMRPRLEKSLVSEGGYIRSWSHTPLKTNISPEK